jgi:enediyne biosynthesis protein E3
VTLSESLGNILRPLFTVSDREATAFSSEGDRQAAQRLETVVRMVTRGCQWTLQNSKFEVLAARLDAVEPELRGFAYEGAGVGLAALDCLFPWKNRVRAFLDGPGAAYIYAVPLGAGMALARLRRKPERFLKRLDPVMGWLILDGYGFHEGFFARKRYVTKQYVPTHLSPYARRVFDQGLGRSIWFSAGTNIQRVTATITAFPESRQAGLWSGVGLACSYTGGVDRPAIEALKDAVGIYRSSLALGVAIGANARHSVGNPWPNAELACEVLWEQPSQTVSHMVDLARENLPTDGEEPAYEVWRQRIAARFEAQTRAEVVSYPFKTERERKHGT